MFGYGYLYGRHVVEEQRRYSKSADPSVNMDFWYDDKTIQQVLAALLKDKDLTLLDGATGLVFNKEGVLHIANNCSFSLGYNFVFSPNTELMNSKLHLISEQITKIIAWNKQQLSEDKPQNVVKNHKFLLPTNINDSHWVTLELIISIEQNNGSDFCLAEEIITNIHDSGPRRSRSAVNIGIFATYLQQHCLSPSKITQVKELISTKTQTDHSSCGVVTVKNIWALLSGENIDQHYGRYTYDETSILRAEHLKVVADENFTQAQWSVVAHMPEKKLNCDSFKHAQALYQFVVDNIAVDQHEVVFTLMRVFINADEKMFKISKQSGVTTKDYEEFDKAYRESLGGVKKWFNNNFSQLCAKKLLNTIFDASEQPASEDDLKWVDSGKDTLVEVLKRLLALVKRPQQIKLRKEIATEEDLAIQRDLELQKIAPRLAPGELIELKIKTPRYQFRGWVDNFGRPHGNCEEKLLDTYLAAEYYVYSGEFHDGKKVGHGQEDYVYRVELDTPIMLSFIGIRHRLNSNLSHGRIRCIIGDELSNGHRLLYEGNVVDGVLNGRGKAFAVNKFNKPEMEFDVVFANGRIFQFTLNHGANPKRTLTEQEYETAAQIKQHFIRNSANIIIDQDENEINVIRMRTIERALKARELKEIKVMELDAKVNGPAQEEQTGSRLSCKLFW